MSQTKEHIEPLIVTPAVSSMYAKLLAAVEDNVCLTIEEGSCFPLTSFEKKEKAGNNKVLVRTSIKHLFEICCWIMKGNKVEGTPRKGAAISGPPGDGRVSATHDFTLLVGIY